MGTWGAGTNIKTKISKEAKSWVLTVRQRETEKSDKKLSWEKNSQKEVSDSRA